MSVSGPNTFNENETIAKYEIMDGAPVRGQCTKLLLFLFVQTLLAFHPVWTYWECPSYSISMWYEMWKNPCPSRHYHHLSLHSHKFAAKGHKKIFNQSWILLISKWILQSINSTAVCSIFTFFTSSGITQPICFSSIVIFFKL